VNGSMGPAAPPVSVVIAAYNGERYLEQTLRAVQAQAVRPEIIVVDDGSTDGSCDLVRRVAPEARLIRQANGGVSSARNNGLAAARGEFVAFLDQDDIWHTSHLERQLAALVAHPGSDVAASPFLRYIPQAGRFPEPDTQWPAPRPMETDPHFSGWIYHQFMADCWALTSATTIRRTVLESLGGFDVGLPYSEDWELFLRLSRVSQWVRPTLPTVLYRQHPDQGSRKERRRDYRVELLLQFKNQHGLASRDGRSLTPRQFADIVAGYRREFGYHHLQHGHRWTGVRALWQAWRENPAHSRSLLLALAGASGWRPRRPSRESPT
jgi:glycosyltransferase involved in cell wall biosynthesis